MAYDADAIVVGSGPSGVSVTLPMLEAGMRVLLLDGGKASLPPKEDIEDPTAWVNGQFLLLLGRPAAKDELETFVRVFHRPECRPETIVYALLSNAEYHRY